MRLIICGNGFDLHHGLKTQPTDYRNYLDENEPDVLDSLNSCDYFMGKHTDVWDPSDSFWSNVESEFRFDFSPLMEETKSNYYPNLNDDSDSRWHAMQVDAEEQTARFGDVQKFNTISLTNWIKSIDDFAVAKSTNFRLNPDDIFVTFNYTLTLERLYAVPSSRVLHLHGCITSPSTMQFGNPKRTSEQVEKDYERLYGNDEFYGASIEFAAAKYASLEGSFSKDLSKNLPVLKNFIHGKSIDEVVIMGHSYQGVDFYYYEKLFMPMLKNAQWTIFCWNKNPCEEVEAKDFFAKFQLKGKIAKW